MARPTAALLLLALLAACGSSTTPAARTPATPPAASGPTSPQPPATGSTLAPPTTAICGRASAPPPAYQHVVWIWMENHRWDQVLGDPGAAPYETALATECGTATHYASVGSPSLPNYLGATSGSTHGISDDDDPSSHPLTTDNLFRQIRAAGGTERSYEEAMASPCQRSSAGRYAVRHNPAPYYVGADDRAACQSDDLPFAALAADLAAGRLPTFSFVTPDLCHDTHDCGVSTGDAWLARELPTILGSPAYRTSTTVVFVIWDEYTPMPSVVIAPSVRPGTVVSMPVNHFALLRTTEELLGLPAFLGSAASAPSLRSAFGI